MNNHNDIFRQIESNMNELVEKNVNWSNSATKDMLDSAKKGNYNLTL